MPTILTLLAGIGGRTRPMFNITISNVPGPDKPLYFRGAELVAIYPASIVTHGQALNITCESYAGAMNFGFTGCHASLPSMQRLAVYAEDALAELEAAMVTKPKTPPKSRKPAQSATAKSSKSSAKKPAAAIAGEDSAAIAPKTKASKPKAIGSPVVAKRGAPLATRKA